MNIPKLSEKGIVSKKTFDVPNVEFRSKASSIIRSTIIVDTSQLLKIFELLGLNPIRKMIITVSMRSTGFQLHWCLFLVIIQRFFN